MIKYDLGFPKINNIIKDFCSYNELFQKVIFERHLTEFSQSIY